MSEWDSLTPEEILTMYDNLNPEECPMCQKHLPEEKRKMWNTYDDGYEITYFCSVKCMINYIKPKLVYIENTNSSSE